MRGRLGVGLALLVWGCAAPGALSHRSAVVRQLLPSTVQIRVERDGGARRAASGVVVAAEVEPVRSWIVTTRHLLDPPGERQQVHVSAPGRKGRAPGVIVAVSAELDLAIIRLDGVALPAVTFKETVQLGEEVWVVAYPWGRRQTIVSGVVSQLAADDGSVTVEGTVRMVDASVSYGSSGGGVFDAARGALVGIVESYRTARVAIPAADKRTLDVPVPGETTVISAREILGFLAASGVPIVLEK